MEGSVLDPELYRGDPHPTFSWLRRHDPVAWDDDYKIWVVSRYEDVVHVSKNPQTFCSGRGVLPRTTHGERMISIATVDEPRHGALRHLVNRGFTPRMVSRLEPRIREYAKRSVDAVAERGECDFVEDLALDLPLMVIADMIGIRREDRARFHEWSDTMIAAGGGITGPEVMVRAATAFGEYAAYLSDVFQDRRRHPRDDLVSALVAAFDEGLLEAGGEEAANDELLQFMTLLLVAGNETTRNALSGAMIALIEHPEERRKFVENPDLAPLLTEEILRWVSPVTNFARTLTRDTELRGRRLREGDQVLLLYPSANRDEAQFCEAHRFVADRRPNPHVAFGIGNHFCLGANLARLEIRIMLNELLRLLPDVDFAPGAGPEYAPSAFVRGIVHLPIVFTPESKRA
ncbi:MAG: cytochrome P450 [Myxococcota bacterium]